MNYEKGLLFTLWYLRNRYTYREVTEQFEHSEAVVHKCVAEIVDLIVNISTRLFKWPDIEEIKRIENGFKQQAVSSGVVGHFTDVLDL